MDVRLSGLSTTGSATVAILYDVVLLRSYVPDAVVVTADIRKAFLDSLEERSHDLRVLGHTDIPLTEANVQAMKLSGRRLGLCCFGCSRGFSEVA